MVASVRFRAKFLNKKSVCPSYGIHGFLIFFNFGSEFECRAENNYRVRFLKHYKVVKTMIKWLRAFAKVYIYIVILFKVECKTMITI